ncbi:phosphopantothenoylcysteine decarboxylase-like [Plakobranchus ocellatus]|uniref:Phosphopantothenoylcysteine decarboxylase n=1 Tax=Plakobranchus ocellatus TaxID=259542 RepID=A0AAV4AKT2_9GAST|nr:phosphopantothenoylcysteine decarboxylase-like [Plakobranchus ocellatus]
MPINILVGCTGSVASIKIPKLVHNLLKLDEKPCVKVVATSHALHFFNTDDVEAPVLSDKDEWEMWSRIGDPVLHIELRRWADLFLIAPLDANTLAKIAGGLCDNLLTCVVRAWDSKCPLLFAPAMNTYMWEHPITATQIETLKGFGYQEVPCVSKLLACGDKGFGAMAEVDTLVSVVESSLKNIEKEGSSCKPTSDSVCCL